MLEKGIIEHSDSPYSSPITPVKKRDGTIRLCCDFRKLNSKTIPKSFPIPKAENILDDMNEADVFTILDLKSAYWHIPIHEGDKYKTTFVVPNAKYQWRVLPFGLTDAAFSLSYVVFNILEEFRSFARSFYDDCIIFSKREDQIRHVKTILDKFEKFGIQINFRKCQFAKEEVDFLGYVVSKNGITPQNVKTLEILEFQTPSNTSELKRFLGMASFFRKFVDNFSSKASVLYSMLKRNQQQFIWTTECEESFCYIKNELRNPNILVHPNFEKPFILILDASNKAIGHALLQEVTGELRPVLFGGRVLSDTEQRYSTTDKELLSIYFAAKKCEFYLVGHKSVVYTDHKPLIYLKTFRALADKRIRWINYLENINTVIRYIPGKENVLSDFISRTIKKEEVLNVVNCYSLQLDLCSYDQNDLGIKQLNDPELSLVIDYFESVTKPKSMLPSLFKRYEPQLHLNDGILLYYHHGQKLFVVPTDMKTEMLQLAHSQFLSGHQGR